MGADWSYLTDADQVARIALDPQLARRAADYAQYIAMLQNEPVDNFGRPVLAPTSLTGSPTTLLSPLTYTVPPPPSPTRPASLSVSTQPPASSTSATVPSSFELVGSSIPAPPLSPPGSVPAAPPFSVETRLPSLETQPSGPSPGSVSTNPATRGTASLIDQLRAERQRRKTVPSVSASQLPVPLVSTRVPSPPGSIPAAPPLFPEATSSEAGPGSLSQAAPGVTSSTRPGPSRKVATPGESLSAEQLQGALQRLTKPRSVTVPQVLPTAMSQLQSRLDRRRAALRQEEEEEGDFG